MGGAGYLLFQEWAVRNTIDMTQMIILGALALVYIWGLSRVY